MPNLDEIRARHPLTLRHVGEVVLHEYAARGGGGSFADFVLARHGEGSIPHRAVRDLVRYEDELARLRTLPPLAPAKEPLPAPDVPLTLSPHVALVTYGADLPGVVESLAAGRPAQPRPRRAWYLLLPRGEGDVDVRHLGRDDGWTLERFRTPATPASVADALEDEEDALDAPWSEGVLVRA